MKRLISFILIALSIFSVYAIDTQAEYRDIEYSWVEVGAFDTPVLILDIIIPIDSTGVEILVPFSEYHLFESNDVNSYIRFERSNGTLISQFNVSSYQGNIAGFYTFNWDNLNIETPFRMFIVIVQNVDYDTFDWVDYTTFLAASDSLMYQYDTLVSNRWTLQYDPITNAPRIHLNFDVIQDARIISIFIPEAPYHRTANNAYTNEIIFFDTGFNVLDTYAITDFNFNLISGLIKIDIVDDLGYQLGDIGNIRINIPQEWDSGYVSALTAPPFYLQYMQEETNIQFNDRLYYVRYYVDGILWDTGIFSTIPNQIPNPVTPNQTFEGWYLANGNRYDFQQPITQTQLFNNELYLYAKITNRPPIDTNLGDPEPSEFFGTIFETIGMNSQVGYVIMYLITIIISLVGLKAINLPNILLMIVMLLITALFMFMGFLPVLMAIVAFGVIALILFSNMGGAV